MQDQVRNSLTAPLLPNKIIIGKQFLENQTLEFKNRKKEESFIINENKISEIANQINHKYKGQELING